MDPPLPCAGRAPAGDDLAASEHRTPQQAGAISPDSKTQFRRRQLLGHLLALIVIGLGVRYVCADWERLRRLTVAAPDWLPPVALIVVSNLLARAWLLGKLTREAAVPVAWGECFCLMAASNMLGMLTLPATGFVYRAAYLSRRRGLPISVFTAGTSLFTLAGMLAWSTLGIVCLTQLELNDRDVNRPALLLLVVGLLAALGVVVAYRLLRLIAGRVPARLERLVVECSAVLSSRRLAANAIAIMAGCAVVQACGFYLAFQSMSLPLSPASSTAIAAVHQVSGTVGITPGSIGAQEGGAVFLSAVLGLDFTAMVTALAFLRASRVGLSILIGAPCWWFLRHPAAPTVHSLGPAP
jgi:uncharacterized membrane protein YbhN (UPF0104 family)